MDDKHKYILPDTTVDDSCMETATALTLELHEVPEWKTLVRAGPSLAEAHLPLTNPPAKLRLPGKLDCSSMEGR